MRLYLLALLILAGCGSGFTNSAAIQGKWKVACIPDGSASKELHLEFTQADGYMIVISYTDNSCSLGRSQAAPKNFTYRTEQSNITLVSGGQEDKGTWSIENEILKLTFGGYPISFNRVTQF